MNYKFLENIAIADSAFEVEGKNLAEIFEGAGLATMETMVNLKTVNSQIKKEIKMSGKDASQLLFDFLNELVFLKDCEKVLFSKFEVDLKEGYYLVVKAFGEKIDQKKHELYCDVKAVTMYQFKVWREGEKWKARVVLDV